ncbi:MAG TPA: hypothetical protein PLV68_06400 [Ilumatobacteraceae bacterium]|nr:hypothetical protein [Ilumatobacteraceae bacterium]
MPSNPLNDPTWAPKLADTVERVVGQVRDKTTKPLLVAYRGLVFGLVAAFSGVFMVILVVITAIRSLQALIEIGTSHHDAVWISYLAIGALFSIAGLVLLKKRFPSETAS